MLSVELFLQNTVHRYVLPTNLLNLALFIIKSISAVPLTDAEKGICSPKIQHCHAICIWHFIRQASKIIETHSN